ncbi:mechanosensitive ion channel domain-containing protein [Robiginitalea marina]|uniref:Mechanosensitive ion channel family protein n=1 Tax=Robiginitalea marina TaxID=2954105 RepID=A0ABT1AU37_9FLAO|nr:mechanosensitive ion channel domain-containing protein [Robiginitalea marina]MCO5723384.1 mechanosensitive ion channel family protein [Robiginitalea marina]
MKDLLLTYQSELFRTLLTFLILGITRFISIKAIRKVGRISDINEIRTRLIVKYVVVGHSMLFLAALLLIWGVSIKDLGLILSSVLAVIGVALFASWSILSNVTAGVILFFSFPFKIGDRIRVWDKELEYHDEFIIEDIRAFHVHLRKPDGELVTYPNNLLLQKAISLLGPLDEDTEGSEAV